MTVDGGAGFGKYENPEIALTVGENATLDPRLRLGGVAQSVTVSSDTAPIETTKTEVSQTVEQRRINNLPINGRNYINFHPHQFADHSRRFSHHRPRAQ